MGKLPAFTKMITQFIYDAKSSSDSKIGRTTGFIDLADFTTLMQAIENKINPRGASTNKIVTAVYNTLRSEPELFWLKSKGLLLATTSFSYIDSDSKGDLISVSFAEHDNEGIMDGGHTALAIATFITDTLYGVKKRTWTDCKQLWRERHEDILRRVRNDLASPESSKFANIKIPVDFIYPQSDENIDYFLNNRTTICGARNANIQLTETSQLRHDGLFDILKETVQHPELFQWKEEEDSGIRLNLLASIAAIPLKWLMEQGLLPEVQARIISDYQFYNSKKACLAFYREVLSDPSVSTKINGRYKITNPLVVSALKLTKDLLSFYDKLYIMFPSIYNSVPGHAFGKTTACRVTPKAAKFGTTTKMATHSYQEGFIIPLIVAARELLYVAKNGKELKWVKRPSTITLGEFTKDSRPEMFIDLLQNSRYHPVIFCKATPTYKSAISIMRAIRADALEEQKK